jgi:hypothetical protein
MLTPEISPMKPYDKQPPARKVFGHQSRVASKCGHKIHPSASEHTPWCHACTLALARAKRDVANQELVAEGGLHPPDYMRDWWWNYARKGYLIAKQRLEKVQRDNQLRCEREEAWDEAHQRHLSLRNQAPVLPQTQHPSLCIVCHSMASSYPTNMPEAPVADNVAWWERPGTLSTEPGDTPETQTPPRPRNRYRSVQSNPTLRIIVHHARTSFYHRRRQEQVWAPRWQAEMVLRRKLNLPDAYEFPEEYWKYPIPSLDMRRQREQIQIAVRKEERTARGNTMRPLPPRSALSQAESAEDVQYDPEAVEALEQKEKREALERAIERITPRVAEEVGYLYISGPLGEWMNAWAIAWDISDWELVVRIPQDPNSETSGEEDENSSDGNEAVGGENEAVDGENEALGGGTEAVTGGNEATGGGDAMDTDN